MILNRAKVYYENNKELLRERERAKEREQKINTESYLRKKKIQKENIQKTDIITCLKKKKQKLKKYQKNYRKKTKTIKNK